MTSMPDFHKQPLSRKQKTDFREQWRFFPVEHKHVQELSHCAAREGYEVGPLGSGRGTEDNNQPSKPTPHMHTLQVCRLLYIQRYWYTQTSCLGQYLKTTRNRPNPRSTCTHCKSVDYSIPRYWYTHTSCMGQYLCILKPSSVVQLIQAYDYNFQSESDVIKYTVIFKKVWWGASRGFKKQSEAVKCALDMIKEDRQINGTCGGGCDPTTCLLCLHKLTCVRNAIEIVNQHHSCIMDCCQNCCEFDYPAELSEAMKTYKLSVTQTRFSATALLIINSSK